MINKLDRVVTKLPIVDVKQLNSGARLAEEVYSALGGVLFSKGTLLSEKEIEFLEAFMVKKVHIEEASAGNTTEQAEAPADEQAKASDKLIPVKPAIQETFEKAVSTLKNLMVRVQGGNNIPVMEVREVVTPIITEFQQQPQVLLSLRRFARMDSYTYEHAIAVGIISYMIAKWIKVPEKEWMQVALAGTLLDIGKTKIDRRILQKPGKLTEEEFEEMKKHTVYGYQIIKASHGLSEGVALAALQHHEREDGSGYPLGLPGSKLHLYSKIVAVADVYHAMCSDRIYQKALSPYVVVEQLVRDSFGKLDPTIVRKFVDGITQFTIGTIVELSDGTIGKIVFTDRNHPTRPMVETGGKIVNLVDARHLSIIRVLEQS
ncbi:HD family phosphohydrolase [Brevibacillus agri]|uniref:HD family phosphohydrolase n=1 Tax=Brevibacillus agri TaxID=51101 RepID=A0A3M8A7I3_9BACL|nr:HD-GYP domain-containing protein [Brevibacillus agri]MCG5254750.1 HD-GYP domain-containing protein [Brevibacillus agri]MED1822481.1 HD-GYP domain-containing protein [Brevibacillus agri]QAV11794.1 c-di-GMP phosphodiesterase [Brevibacillus agri]RNB47198.1 HD-GYP domain-containing protein [Brevibacillus agri]WHX30747.1 HD-GYP domain-containing protein [Brevibacillus agri]